MAKNKSVYVCQQCGTQKSRWEGRCNDCGAWNSLVEERVISTPVGSRSWSVAGDKNFVELGQTMEVDEKIRVSTGIHELDRVLGGGLVNGSFVLVGGDPGVGKSTLLLQMSVGLAHAGQDVIYISAEESAQQISLRAQRLKLQAKNVRVKSESRLQEILALAEKETPQVLIVDSIQTVYLDDISSAPGSVAQVRECAAKLMGLAKGKGISVFVIGHVTKEGTLAGPRVLEHMVDTVLSFEGDQHNQYRLLRAIKNRFGAANELGVFEMVTEGMREVQNPSALFLDEREQQSMGSAIFAAIEGSRPILCEVQALTASSPMAMPRRTSLGFDLNRVHMLCAVIDKYLSASLAHQDVFINVVGGLRLSEPAADLAVSAALLSSLYCQPLPMRSLFFGEIGLTGEIRPINFIEERLKEAIKLGFKQVYVPAGNKRQLKDSTLLKEIGVHWISFIDDLNKLFQVKPKKSSPRQAPAEA